METIKKVLKQTSWQVLGKVVSSLSTLVILGFITRSYGEEGTGIYTLALTYLAFFFLAADLGLNAYVLPKILSNSNEANDLFNFRLAWSFVLLILCNLLVYLFPFKSVAFNQSVLFGSISIIFSGIFNSSNLIFQNKLRYDQSVLSQTLGSITSLIITSSLALNNASIQLLALGPLMGWAVNCLVAFFLVKKMYDFRFQIPDFNYPLKTLKVAWPISLTLVLNIIYFRVDTFILSALYSFKEVGTYNLAYQVFSNTLVLPTFIMNSFYPMMVRTLVEDKKYFLKQIKNAGILIFTSSLLVLITVWFTSPMIIQLLSGYGFEGSIKALQILTLGFPAYFLSSLLMWTLVSLEKYKSIALVYFLGLVANWILNLIFIPKFSFIAAAWVTGVSEYLILFLLTTILYKELKIKPKSIL